VDEYCPLHEPMVDKITIITHTGKYVDRRQRAQAIDSCCCSHDARHARSRFRFMPINTSEYSFSFNPEEGILKKVSNAINRVSNQSCQQSIDSSSTWMDGCVACVERRLGSHCNDGRSRDGHCARVAVPRS